MPGFGHLAELCLKDALKDNELIKRVRMAVNTVRKSSLAKDLRSRCLNLEYESLISPADTRWSYEYTMIKRFLEIASEINVVLENDKITEEPFSTHDIQILQAWLPTLAAFERVTRQAEGESYCSAPLVPSWICSLEEETRFRYEAIKESADLRSTLRASVRERLLPLLEVAVCPKVSGNRRVYCHPSGVKVGYCVLAAALDPARAKLEFLSEDQRRLVWERLEYEAGQSYPRSGCGD